MTEKEKFLKWHKKEVDENGLVDMNITINPLVDKSGMSEENIYRSLNVIIEEKSKGNCKEITYL